MISSTEALTPYQQDMLNRIVDAQYNAAEFAARPSVQLRATLQGLPGEWHCTYGALRGTGSSPEAAFADFDRRWNSIEALP